MHVHDFRGERDAGVSALGGNPSSWLLGVHFHAFSPARHGRDEANVVESTFFVVLAIVLSGKLGHALALEVAVGSVLTHTSVRLVVLIFTGIIISWQALTTNIIRTLQTLKASNSCIAEITYHLVLDGVRIRAVLWSTDLAPGEVSRSRDCLWSDHGLLTKQVLVSLI